MKPLTKKNKKDLQTALTKHAGDKAKQYTVSGYYEFKPPTKEQIAEREKQIRRDKHNQMREIALYLEGVKSQNIGSRIERGHLETLWGVIHKMRTEI